jgi:histidyl-tRNA synthetase
MTNKQPLQTLKGFRDILPQEKRQRDWVLNQIIQTYQTFGFEPLETPTLEYADLLLGKYGEEADKLVYTFEDQGERQVGLRYDQTVPVARILAQYRNNMPKFFRRYQIQNVFRAEKPQAGRFREFTQCDIDIFGTDSTLADAEILACVYAAYKNIGFEQIKILINDRRLLVKTLRPLATEQVSALSIVQTLDKLNKIGQKKVIQELIDKGLPQDTAQQCLDQVKQLQPSNNLSTIIEQAAQLGISKQDLVFTPTLARGLDYYTGMIFEVRLPQYETGSLGGGGRYDDLIKQLGGIEMPAVGFGMGFDRTVEAANQLGLIPNLQASAQVLVTLFDQTTIEASLKTATQLRQAGISVELYPELDKIGKQLKIANQKQIPWVIIIGQEEATQNQVALKNMKSGNQISVSLDEAIAAIQT